jgi:rubrerythrin
MDDIIKFAMKMEIDGKAFYEKEAAATDNAQLKQVLTTLAEEEDRHFRFFKQMMDNPTSIPSLDAFSSPGTVKDVQNIFQTMAAEDKDKQFGDDVITVWTEALRIEEKAVAFYTEKADAESDTDRKNLLAAIAEEEQRHVHMIDSVLMYLKQPQAFAQSAQYKNFMSLEGR